MAEVEIPSILATIVGPDYSESDLISVLQDLFTQSEDHFVIAFLQFFVDCAEQEISVTHAFRTGFASLFEVDPVPVLFIAYRNPQLNEALDEFLRVCLAVIPVFKSSLWMNKVLDLLKALIATGDRFSVCGLYFSMRILINCLCNKGTTWSSRDVDTIQFTKELFKLYDQDLLNNHNFVDIWQGLMYLFEFYWQDILVGDPSNARHLSGLILVATNYQMKRDLLKTIATILSADQLPTNVRTSIISELETKKDLLIAICYHAPNAVAKESLSLLTTYSQELIPCELDQDKVFLLMTKPQHNIQVLAKAFFLQSIESSLNTSDREQRGNVYLRKLEKLFTDYEDAIENMSVLVELLMDSFPSFVEIYLYIVHKSSQIISKITTIVMDLLRDSVAAADGLLLEDLPEQLKEMANISAGALQQLATTQQWSIYQDVLYNLQAVLDCNYFHDSINSAAVQIRGDIVGYDVDTQCLRSMVRVWLNIMIINYDRDQVGEVLERSTYGGNWMVPGILLEGIFLRPDFEFQEQFIALSLQAYEQLGGSPEDTAELINVLHLIMLRPPIAEVEVDMIIMVLELIDGRFLKVDLPCASDFSNMLRVAVHLILALIGKFDLLTVDQRNVLHSVEWNMHTWILRWTTENPYSVNWQLYMVVLYEFSLMWMDEDIFSPILAVQLSSPETQPFASQFLKAIFKNHFVLRNLMVPSIVSSDLMRRIVHLVSKTLHSLNVLNLRVSESKLAGKTLLDGLREVLDPSINISSILLRAFMQLLNMTADYLAGLQESNRHRFKTLDVLLELPFEDVSSEDRRLILSCVGDIQNLSLNDAEKTTMQKVVSCLH